MKYTIINIESKRYEIGEDFIGNFIENFSRVKYAFIDTNLVADMIDLQFDKELHLSKIVKVLFFENNLLNQFYNYVIQEFDNFITEFIIKPPDYSEDDISLDGVIRKYVELKGHKVILDLRTDNGRKYYFTERWIKAIKKEIDNNGSLIVLYMKDVPHRN